MAQDGRPRGLGRQRRRNDHSRCNGIDRFDRLPQDAVVTIGKKDRTRDVPQEDMVHALNLDEKFGLAVPMLDIGEPIKGRRPWERYLHLKGIRDDLVHVKNRGVDSDREVRTAYDRLLLGDADTCAKDAFDIVQAARPGFLGRNVVEHLVSASAGSH